LKLKLKIKRRQNKIKKKKPQFKKAEMHRVLPFGYCGKCISAEEGRYISTQINRR